MTAGSMPDTHRPRPLSSVSWTARACGGHPLPHLFVGAGRDRREPAGPQLMPDFGQTAGSHRRSYAHLIHTAPSPPTARGEAVTDIGVGAAVPGECRAERRGMRIEGLDQATQRCRPCQGPPPRRQPPWPNRAAPPRPSRSGRPGSPPGAERRLARPPRHGRQAHPMPDQSPHR
jgi:hypothetical protein